MMNSFKALCDSVTDPKKCPDLWGVFSYMPNRGSSGECGIKNGTWCWNGKDTMAYPGQNKYYALCASAIGEPCYLVKALHNYKICRINYASSYRCWKQHLQGIWWYPMLHVLPDLCKWACDILRHWLQFWHLRTWIHDNLCYLSIKSDTGQHSQFLWCLYRNNDASH